MTVTHSHIDKFHFFATKLRNFLDFLVTIFKHYFLVTVSFGKGKSKLFFFCNYYNDKSELPFCVTHTFSFSTVFFSVAGVILAKQYKI